MVIDLYSGYAHTEQLEQEQEAQLPEQQLQEQGDILMMVWGEIRISKEWII